MKRKSLIFVVAMVFILSCSTMAFAKESVKNNEEKTEKSPAAPSVAAAILKDADISHMYQIEGEKPGNYVADVAAEMGSSAYDNNGSWFQEISKFDKVDYLNAVQNFLFAAGAPLSNVVAEDFGVMDISDVIGYTVGFGLVNATAADVDLIVIELYKDTTVLGTLTSSGVQANYPTATSLSGPFDVLGSFDYGDDGNWTYSGWLGTDSDIPDKAEITVTFKNGLVWTATNTDLTGDTSIFTAD
jgi:hypothetical protein